MADEVGERETCQIRGNPNYSIEVNSLQESDLMITLASRQASYEAIDPNDSADSSDFSPLPRRIPNLQGIPTTSLSQRSRKRRKQLHPNKSLSLVTDSAETSQCSSPVSSPPHPMEVQSQASEVAILEEREEDEDTCVEVLETEAPNNASLSKGPNEEKSSSSKKKPKKSEVEILFSSMTTVDMAALYVRNRTDTDSWYSPRKASPNATTSFAGSSIPVSPSRTAAVVSKVINEVNLSRIPRSRAVQASSSRPTVSLPRVTTAALRQRKTGSAAVAGPSGVQNRPKQTARQNKKPDVPAPQAHQEESTAQATSPQLSDDSMASSSRTTGTTDSSLRGPQQTETVSTRCLPSAKSFKATFSFDEMFCKYPPEIMLKDGELVPVHSMAVPLHAKVPQDHYLRKWKINRRRHGDGNGSVAQTHTT